MPLHDTNSLFSCELFFSLLDVYSWPRPTTAFFTRLFSCLSASLQCSVSLDHFVFVSSLFHLFPSLSFLLYFFERKHYRLLTCMFISLHYIVPHTVGSIISIVSRLCMDTLLFSLSRSLYILQRFHSLTHSSDDCSRVSRWLFSDKEICAVYMDETKSIYISMALVFCCSTLSSTRKMPIDQTRVCLFFLSIASG